MHCAIHDTFGFFSLVSDNRSKIYEGVKYFKLYTVDFLAPSHQN